MFNEAMQRTCIEILNKYLVRKIKFYDIFGTINPLLTAIRCQQINMQQLDIML